VEQALMLWQLPHLLHFAEERLLLLCPNPTNVMEEAVRKAAVHGIPQPSKHVSYGPWPAGIGAAKDRKTLSQQHTAKHASCTATSAAQSQHDGV
jgi:hypothetical protein